MKEIYYPHPNELRLGNFVYNDTQQKIVEVNLKILSEQIYNWNKQKNLWQAVLLTENILVKLGFKLTKNTHPWSYYIGEEKRKKWKTFRIQYGTLMNVKNVDESIKGFYLIYIHGNYWRPCYYLHDLQNIISGLTRNELKLNDI